MLSSTEERIFVTKSFLPPFGEYETYIKQVFQNGQLTNQGPLLQKLQEKLSCYLDVKNLHYVTNGTIAIQLALKALDIENGEIITTPFSYVATVSSILWERCTPVFVDIEADNFTIDPDKIEKAITPKTKAIIAVHVFGYACNTEKIEAIARKHNIKVIYDAAHAFGSLYKNKSLLDFGDISTCSFHATKLFHTIEGGACIVKDKAISDRLELIKRFGHQGDEHFCLGINAKQSEINAAMGLANFEYLNEILAKRRQAVQLYDNLLCGLLQRPAKQKDLQYNNAYYPVLFKNEQQLLSVFLSLNEKGIFPRRYFYPSLNKLPYINKTQDCPVSENISSRIACLPLFNDITEKQIKTICNIIRGELA